jgi:hypothetical protein
MKIQRYEFLTEEELLSRLKRTRLRGDGQGERPEVYRNATVEIYAQADPESLAPAQRYVLADGVARIMDLREAFAELGVDIFGLRGGVLFWPDEGSSDSPGEAIPIIPPVIEESTEPDGRKVLIINDGIHRVYAARKLGRRINVVLARNVPPEYPYYAYALENGWADVTELAELQDGYQKKAYRNPQNYKALFRDFNEVFQGVQKQRKQTNPMYLKA